MSCAFNEGSERKRSNFGEQNMVLGKDHRMLRDMHTRQLRNPHAGANTTTTAFSGAVAAAAAWSIFGGDMFPAEPDPKGNPEGWTREELRRWLAAVGPWR